MLVPLIQFIQGILIPLGAWGVFAGSVLEEVIAPIPSAVVQLTAGFVFLHGPFTWTLLGRLFFIVAIPAAFGVVLGSLVFYYIGTFIGPPFIDRFGTYVGLSKADISRLEVYFKRGSLDELLVFSLRALPIVPSVAVAFFAGFVRVPIWTYIVFSFLGVIIRASILAVIGWWVGNLYVQYIDVVNKFESAFWIVIAIAVIVGIFMLLKRQQKNKNNGDILVP